MMIDKLPTPTMTSAVNMAWMSKSKVGMLIEEPREGYQGHLENILFTSHPPTLTHYPLLRIENDPALHGVYFDDQVEYDYMQHLKTIGQDPSAVFLEPKGKQKSSTVFSGGDIALKKDVVESSKSVSFALPSDAMPSRFEDDVGQMNRGDGRIEGLGLDMDPALRQALCALEDEAFVDDELDDDFFAQLDGDELPEDYVEEGLEDGGNEEDDVEGGDAWYKEYKR